MSMERVVLAEVHGGYQPSWDYAAMFDIRDDQEGTVLAESWVQNVYRLTPHRLDGSGVVIDCGACFGAFSVLAWRLGAKVVHAYEPHTGNANRLRSTLATNGVPEDRVIVHERAVGYGDRPYYTIGSGVTAGVVPIEDEGGDYERAVGLNTIVRNVGPIDVLKVDIEGSEYDLFAGAHPDALVQVRFVAMEWHGDALSPGVKSAQIGVLVERLLYTHHVEVSGQPPVGGMLWATLR